MNYGDFPAQRDSIGAQAPAPVNKTQLPATTHIQSNLEHINDATQRVAERLAELLQRLHGPQPPSASVNVARETRFTDGALGALDRQTVDIAARLDYIEELTRQLGTLA